MSEEAGGGCISLSDEATVRRFINGPLQDATDLVGVRHPRRVPKGY
jgi:hypothetical protein